MSQSIEIPEQIPGTPEAGSQLDIFGDWHRFTPKSRGQITQISMDDQIRLENLKQEAIK